MYAHQKLDIYFIRQNIKNNVEDSKVVNNALVHRVGLLLIIFQRAVPAQERNKNYCDSHNDYNTQKVSKFISKMFKALMFMSAKSITNALVKILITNTQKSTFLQQSKKKNLGKKKIARPKLSRILRNIYLIS